MSAPEVLAALITAVLAGAFAFCGSWLATRQQRIERDQVRTIKLADFRQDWINCLREDLAEFAAISTRAPDNAENLRTMAELLHRIELRMNPSDVHYGELMQVLAQAYSSNSGLTGPETALPAVKLSIASGITSVGQKILKREWERLKHDLRSVEERGRSQGT